MYGSSLESAAQTYALLHLAQCALGNYVRSLTGLRRFAGRSACSETAFPRSRACALYQLPDIRLRSCKHGVSGYPSSDALLNAFVHIIPCLQSRHGPSGGCARFGSEFTSLRSVRTGAGIISDDIIPCLLRFAVFLIL